MRTTPGDSVTWGAQPGSKPPSTLLTSTLQRDKSILCSRFFDGACAVVNCPFAHFKRDQELPIPETLCRFHNPGKGTTCKRDECRFFHGSPEAFHALLKKGEVTYRPQDFLPIRDPQDNQQSEESKVGEMPDWKQVLEEVPTPWSATGKSTASGSTTPGSGPSSVGPLSRSQSHTQLPPAVSGTYVSYPSQGVGLVAAPAPVQHVVSYGPQPGMSYPQPQQVYGMPPTYVLQPAPISIPAQPQLPTQYIVASPGHQSGWTAMGSPPTAYVPAPVTFQSQVPVHVQTVGGLPSVLSYGGVPPMVQQAPMVIHQQPQMYSVYQR